MDSEARTSGPMVWPGGVRDVPGLVVPGTPERKSLPMRLPPVGALCVGAGPAVPRPGAVSPLRGAGAGLAGACWAGACWTGAAWAGSGRAGAGLAGAGAGFGWGLGAGLGAGCGAGARPAWAAPAWAAGLGGAGLGRARFGRFWPGFRRWRRAAAGRRLGRSGWGAGSGAAAACCSPSSGATSGAACALGSGEVAVGHLVGIVTTMRSGGA
jgi:hypothetical protein